MKYIDKNILIQALDQLPVGTVLVDARQEHWPVIYMNSIIAQLTGLDAQTLLGCPWQGLLADPAELDAQRERLLGSPTLVVRHLKQRWQSRSGEPVDLTLQVSPLFARPGHPAYWLISVDIDQLADGSGEDTLRLALRDAQLRLLHLDRSDAITGLASRQAFLEAVQRHWAIAGPEQRRISVLVFQVEALERYRELYGRHAADSCLRKIGHALNGSLRRTGDVTARVADNRFAALVGAAEEHQARGFAAQIARKVRELAIHHPRSSGGRYVSVNIGFASAVPPWGESENHLLQQAEADVASGAGDRRADMQAGQG
ncbi:MAG: diguanylate cyclase [Gammaproteobacteria bacterium]|nr:diguanylate cyclase [Gammaproteobacteria bacterium]